MGAVAVAIMLSLRCCPKELQPQCIPSAEARLLGPSSLNASSGAARFVLSVDRDALNPSVFRSALTSCLHSFDGLFLTKAGVYRLVASTTDMYAESSVRYAVRPPMARPGRPLAGSTER